MPAIARAILSRVDVCLAQSHDDAFRFGALGAHHVQMPGNLKYDVPAPPDDPVRRAQLSGSAAGRPLWLAASTHRGEDMAVLQAHQRVAQRAADVLTIIVPRHPERGGEIAALAREAGLHARAAIIGRSVACGYADLYCRYDW